MKPYLKLGIFLAVTVLCFALDAGLGMFGATLLLGVAGAAAEPAGSEPETPAVKPVEDEAAIMTLIKNGVEQQTKEINVKTGELETRLTQLSNKIDTAEALFKMNAPVSEKDKNDFKAMVKNSLIGIYRGKNELITNTFLNETTDAQGKYTVPAEWYGAILDKTLSFSSIMRNAQIFNMNSKTFELVKTASVPTWTFDASEGAERAVGNATFAKVILDRKDGGFIVLFSKRVLEDSAFDLTSYITMLASKAYANAIETAGFTGSISPEIVGLLGASGTTDVELESGSTGFKDLIYDKIIEATDAIPSTELPGAKWFMHRTIWNKVKQLKLDKVYAVSPEDRKAKMLEGFPVELTDKSYAYTDSAADKKFITFGDLKNMALGMRNGLSFEMFREGSVTEGVTTYNLLQQGLVAIRFDGAFDIKYTFPDAIATIKTAEA